MQSKGTTLARSRCRAFSCKERTGQAPLSRQDPPSPGKQWKCVLERRKREGMPIDRAPALCCTLCEPSRFILLPIQRGVVTHPQSHSQQVVQNWHLVQLTSKPVFSILPEIKSIRIVGLIVDRGLMATEVRKNFMGSTLLPSCFPEFGYNPCPLKSPWKILLV